MSIIKKLKSNKIPVPPRSVYELLDEQLDCNNLEDVLDELGRDGWKVISLRKPRAWDNALTKAGCIGDYRFDDAVEFVKVDGKCLILEYVENGACIPRKFEIKLTIGDVYTNKDLYDTENNLCLPTGYEFDRFGI